MSKIVIQYAGFLDSVDVSAATIATGWYAGNVGNLSSAELGLYAGSDQPMFLIVDGPTEAVNPPTGSKVTVMHGQGKVQVVPDDAADWTNVFAGPLSVWAENKPIYVTNAGKLTPSYSSSADASSGSIQIGKVVVAPAVANDYTLTMLLTL